MSHFMRLLKCDFCLHTIYSSSLEKNDAVCAKDGQKKRDRKEQRSSKEQDSVGREIII